MSDTGWRFVDQRRRIGQWAGENETDSYLTPGGSWSDAVRGALPQDEERLWLTLQFLQYLPWSENSASKSWLAEMSRVLNDHPQLLDLAHVMVIQFVKQLETGPAPTRTAEGELCMPAWRSQLEHSGAEYLIRGAVWTLAAAGPPCAAELLTRAARCGRGVAIDEGNLLDVATASIRGLGAMGAIDDLILLKDRITHRGLLRILDKVLLAACTAAGRPMVPRMVPAETFGLDSDGRLHLCQADIEADLLVHATGIEVTWSCQAKLTASTPRRARQDAPVLVEAVRSEAKRLRAAVTAERSRLERLLVDGTTLTVGDWLHLYGEHPLTAPLARALLWRVDGRVGLPTSEPGMFEDLQGHWSPGVLATVSVPHPVDIVPGDLADWRSLIVDRRLRQPFPQVFREVYTVPSETAEDQTSSLAGHVLTYRQADALLRGRGWKVPYRGTWDRGDSEFIATRELRGLRASWRLEEMDHDDEVLPFVRTGSLTLAAGRRAVLPREAPPAVLSEFLRDLDLVVTTSNVTGKGRKVDGDGVPHSTAPDPRSGDLSATSRVRHQALALILPITDLSARCVLDTDVLRVRGPHHRYLVHIGSGQIGRENCDMPLPDFKPKPRPGLFVPTDDPILEGILRSAFDLASGVQQP